MAAAFFAFGLFLLAFALHWIRPAEAPGSTPGWVLAAAALIFLSGGCVPLATVHAWPRWATNLAALGMLLGLATVFNWVAFFPGPRHFTGGGSLFGFNLGAGTAPESSGRIFFGAFAVLLDGLIVAWLWRALVQARRVR
jgi:hypothetical protein